MSVRASGVSLLSSGLNLRADLLRHGCQNGMPEEEMASDAVDLRERVGIGVRRLRGAWQ